MYFVIKCVNEEVYFVLISEEEIDMKRIVCLILTLALLASCILCFASCGEPKDDGAVISVYLGERVFDLDPTDYFVDSNAEQLMALLYDPLFTVNEKGKLKLDGAAEDYDVDEDERTIVITLKESYWSDSEPVKPDDFIYAWRSILLEPNEANPAAALLYDIENAWEIKCGEVSPYTIGAEKTGDYELTIKYREGADYKQLLKNLASVATAPVRQDVITEINSGYWAKFENMNTAVTNGPFCIANFDDKANSFTLARNVGYHQALDVKNYTKEVRPGKLVSFIDPVNGEQELTYKDITEKTVFFMSDLTLEERAANKGNAMVSDDLSTYTYVFNMENPLFADVKVRQALSMAIDRNEIINKIVFGKAATGFISPAVSDVEKKSSFAKGNLISASAKVDEANELLKSVDFTGLEKKFALTVNDDEESIAIADIAIAAWAKLGFTVTKDVKDSVVTNITGENTLKFEDSELQIAVNDATRGENNFDVIAVDWQMYSNDAFVALSAFATNFSGCGVEFDNSGIGKRYGSFGGYADPEYDKLIEDAFNADNKSERSELLHSAEAKLVESACIIPLVFNQSFAFVSRDLSKIEFDGFGNFVFTDAKQKHYRDYLD